MAELDACDAQAEVDSAEAAVAQAAAQLLTITQGGTGSAQVESRTNSSGTGWS